MHKGKYVFSQLLDFLDRNHFNYLVCKYGGDRYVKDFTCYNQLAVLMFGQLSNRESLRDVVLATQAHASKAFHLGFGKYASKSTLSDANNKRDYRIFEEFAYHIVPAGLMISSSLEATYMPFTQRLSSFALRHSSGLCSERTSGRVASKYTHCMTLKRPFPRSFTLPKPGSMTPKRWMQSLTKRVHSTSLTVATMTSAACIT